MERCKQMIPASPSTSAAGEANAANFVHTTILIITTFPDLDHLSESQSLTFSSALDLILRPKQWPLRSICAPLSTVGTELSGVSQSQQGGQLTKAGSCAHSAVWPFESFLWPGAPDIVRFKSNTLEFGYLMLDFWKWFEFPIPFLDASTSLWTSWSSSGHLRSPIGPRSWHPWEPCHWETLRSTQWLC